MKKIKLDKYYSSNDLHLCQINTSSDWRHKIWEFEDYYKIPRTILCKLERMDSYGLKAFLLEIMKKYSSVKETIAMLDEFSLYNEDKREEMSNSERFEAKKRGTKMVENYRLNNKKRASRSDNL